MPADQCLESGYRAVDLRLRLIEKTELVPDDRGAKLMLDGAPLAQPIIHFDLEEACVAAAGGLGAVERCIGIVEQ